MYTCVHADMPMTAHDGLFPCYKTQRPWLWLQVPRHFAYFLGVVLSVLTQAFQAACPKTDLLSCLLWLFREVRRKKHWTGSSWLCARGLGLHPSHHARYCQLPNVNWACRHVELWHHSCIQFALSLLCMGGRTSLLTASTQHFFLNCIWFGNRKSILLASCGCVTPCWP